MKRERALNLAVSAVILVPYPEDVLLAGASDMYPRDWKKCWFHVARA
jgi:hypothetical protein